jgi:hypothetical protein
MPLIEHPTGGYRFLTGIAPYSRGVVSATGHEIVHAVLRRPVPHVQGFDLIEKHLAAEERPLTALCGVELRCPTPYSFEGFAEFNGGYAQILEGWGLFVDGVNPVARTNVAPEINPPAEPVLYGFSYARPCDPSRPPTFVVAGAGELPEGVLAAEAIVRAGDDSPEAIGAKAMFVVRLMEDRLVDLGVGWPEVTDIDVYTVHPIDRLLPRVVLHRAGPAAVHGTRWFYSRPPIVGIEYEMDLRGVRTEVRIV